MKKTIIWMILIFFGLSITTAAQTPPPATPAPEFPLYILNVVSHYFAGGHTVNYTGDYSGTGNGSFKIESFTDPFTVTLEHTSSIFDYLGNSHYRYYTFQGWKTEDDDFIGSTITVDDSNREITVIAMYGTNDVAPPPPTPVELRIEPSVKKVVKGENFTTEIHLDNNPLSSIGAYAINLTYSTEPNGESPIKYTGTVAGSDGLDTNIQSQTPGLLKLVGFDIMGKAPGVDMHILTINWEALEPGEADLILTVDNVADVYGNGLSQLSCQSGKVIVSSSLCGDANADGVTDILDALMAARYASRLAQADIVLGNCDVDGDGSITIIDALLIARFAAGLTEAPCF